MTRLKNLEKLCTKEFGVLKEHMVIMIGKVSQINKTINNEHATIRKNYDFISLIPIKTPQQLNDFEIQLVCEDYMDQMVILLLLL